MTAGEDLVSLMERDLAIARAEKALDELPEKLAVLQLRKRLKEIEAVAEKARAYQRKAEALVSRSNDEAASVQAKIDAEQAKVLSGEISNPKELQSLTRELDALKRRKDAIEHEELGLMEKAEAGEGQVAKIEATLAEGQLREKQLIEEFKSSGGKLQTEVGRLKRERSSVVESMDATLLARYEKLRDAKHGIAVGVLSGDICSACRTQIPANQAQAIIAGPEIAECPNCRRILVVTGKQDD